MQDIKSYEGLYAITKDGRVWSHGKGISTNQFGLFLAQADDSRGYKIVNLTDKQGNQKVRKVHQLVALTYVPISEDLLAYIKSGGKVVVNHKDGNKHNNVFSNLEWVTHSENLKHAYASGLRKSNAEAMSRDNNHKSRTNTEELKTLLQRVFDGEKSGDVAKEYGYVRSSVSRLFKQHYGFAISRKETPEARRKDHLINYPNKKKQA